VACVLALAPRGALAVNDGYAAETCAFPSVVHLHGVSSPAPASEFVFYRHAADDELSWWQRITWVGNMDEATALGFLR
jgi:hypothetical protein